MEPVEEGAEFEYIDPQGASSSLSSRMNSRAKELQGQKTERFAVPGYETVIEVEMKPLGFKTIRKLQQRNERVRDEATRDLYNVADQLLTATVGFWEVPEDPDGPRTPLEGETWQSIAARIEGCPDSPTPRVALLFIVTDERIHWLMNEYGEWAKTARKDIDGEVAADFAVTG